MKTKRKVKLNCLSLTGLACFFPQEYQHVHLLWFKMRSLILFWKPNPPLCSVRCAHLRARADAASINQALPTKRSSWKHLSSRDQWNLTPATMCRGSAALAVWSRHFGAAQTMLNFYSHILKKWSEMPLMFLGAGFIWVRDVTDPGSRSLWSLRAVFVGIKV